MTKRPEQFGDSLPGAPNDDSRPNKARRVPTSCVLAAADCNENFKLQFELNNFREVRQDQAQTLLFATLVAVIIDGHNNSNNSNNTITTFLGHYYFISFRPDQKFLGRPAQFKIQQT